MHKVAKFNEELFWKKRNDKGKMVRSFFPSNISKNGLYISDSKASKMINNPSESDKIMCVSLSSIQLDNFKELIIDNSEIKIGLFKLIVHYGREEFRFENRFSEGGAWFKFNMAEISENLIKKSNDLGYTVGTSVNVIPTSQHSRIVSKQVVCLYHVYNTLFNGSGIKHYFTVLFKVENDPNYYQIGHLNKAQEIYSGDSIEGDIRDNFIDLIDDGMLTININKSNHGTLSKYGCDLFSNDASILGLKKLTDCLSVLHGRIFDLGFKVELKEIVVGNRNDLICRISIIPILDNQ